MEKELLFYISHGHGTGNDRGAVSGKFVELELNETVCGYAREYAMDNRGDLPFKIAYPERHGDAMTLQEHIDEIAHYRLRYRTVLIDVHFNSDKNKAGVGAEVWVKPNNRYAKEFAEMILDEQKKIGRPSRGVKVNRNFKIMQADGVVVLPEMGFVSTVKDRKDFDTEAELKEMGYALGKAMIRYAEVYA